MKLVNQGFDHVEYVLNDISPMASVFKRMGFDKVGTRTLQKEGTKTDVYASGFIRIYLTQKANGQNLEENQHSHALDFLKKQNEGICVLALEVDDATKAYEETIKRGARSAKEPTTFQGENGRVVRSEIWTPGNVRYAFMERKNSGNGPVFFDENLTLSQLRSPAPLGIQKIDHLTNNVGIGEMKTWVDYYKDIFQFGVSRHFDIRTGRTGLISEVIESPDRLIKVPVNEPTEKESQVQEFVDRLKGPGVQHLALLVDDIQTTLRTLIKNEFKFLTVPHTYYEEVPTRVPGVTENLNDLEDLGILLDGEGGGYLLQIFSQEILGPFFFEFIQRKGNEGFGEGNFRALFEAIERDQIKRGVLKG